MKAIYLVSTSLMAMALTGCATITRGTHDALVIETDPVGAKVTTSLGKGEGCDATPCSIRAKRNAEFVVTISKPGYKALTIHVTHKVSSGGGTAMAGNVLVGGIIGAAIDGSNGAMEELTPNPIKVKLEKEEAPPPAPSASIVEPSALSAL